MTEPDDVAILRVEGLVAGYGQKHVLRSVSLGVGRGKIVALIGHNGAGKSTFLKALFGISRIWQGQVWFDGEMVGLARPRDWLRKGVVYVPQGGRVFSGLTVKENLQMGGTTLPNKRALNDGMERVFAFFPKLSERRRQRASTLSGGERQMLALGNALVMSPRMLLLDEPSLGLSPPCVSGALERIQQLSQIDGVTILVVEQKVREVLKIAEHVFVLRNGTISFSGVASELKDDQRLKEVYL